MSLSQQVGTLFRKVAKEVLPEGMSLYSVDRKVLFQMRSEAGLVANTDLIAYIVKDVQGYDFKYGITFKNLLNSLESANGFKKDDLEKTFKMALTNSYKAFEKNLEDKEAVINAIKNKEKEAKQLEQQLING